MWGRLSLIIDHWSLGHGLILFRCSCRDWSLDDWMTGELDVRMTDWLRWRRVSSMQVIGNGLERLFSFLSFGMMLITHMGEKGRVGWP